MHFLCLIEERNIGQTCVMQQFKNNSLVKLGVSLKYRRRSRNVLPTFLSAVSASTAFFQLLLLNYWPDHFLDILFQYIFLGNKFQVSVKFGATLKEARIWKHRCSKTKIPVLSLIPCWVQRQTRQKLFRCITAWWAMHTAGPRHPSCDYFTQLVLSLFGQDLLKCPVILGISMLMPQFHPFPGVFFVIGRAR